MNKNSLNNILNIYRNFSRPTMAWTVLIFTMIITMLDGLGIINLKASLIDMWKLIAIGIPIAWIGSRGIEKIKLKKENNENNNKNTSISNEF